MYQRILILAHHGIGDVLMILPLFKTIRKKYPKAKIIIAVKSPVEESILQDAKVGDDYLYLALSKLSWIERIQLIPKLRRECIDLAISTYGINKRLSSILFTLIGAKSTIGFTNGGIRIPFSIELTPTGEHKVKENLRIAASLGIKEFNVDNEWRLNFKNITFAENLFHEHGLKSDSTVIGIHPGCGDIEKHKRWPLDHFRELVSRIVANYDYPIFTFGGPGEEYLTNYIIKGQKGRLINMAGKLSLRQTAALIKKCAIMLGGDSGLIHVATSVKTPVIAIFGPTNPSVTGPYGEHVRIIQSEQECCPCYPKLLTGCGNPICMQNVCVDTVWQVFQEQVPTTSSYGK